ncbi:MAG: hypothetical protein WC378_09210 [Opitutaceae bacterium]|jgi:hypothetical protein
MRALPDSEEQAAAAADPSLPSLRFLSIQTAAPRQQIKNAFTAKKAVNTPVAKGNPVTAPADRTECSAGSAGSEESISSIPVMV